MDEFTKADRDDWELEKAQDRYETGRTDWAELHEVHRGPPSLAELLSVQADLRAQAERNEQLLPAVCPICHGRWTVVIAGPDANGQYDTDDCPCQKDLYG